MVTSKPFVLLETKKDKAFVVSPTAVEPNLRRTIPSNQRWVSNLGCVLLSKLFLDCFP